MDGGSGLDVEGGWEVVGGGLEVEGEEVDGGVGVVEPGG